MCASNGNPNLERAASLALGIIEHLDIAVVERHKLPHKIHAYASAHHGDFMVVVALVEEVEDMVDVFRRDAQALVGDFYAERVIVGAEYGKFHLAALGRIFESVGKNVDYHLVKIFGIYVCLQFFFCSLKEKLHAQRRGVLLERFVHAPAKRHEVGLLKFELHLVTVDLAHVEELVDEVEDALGVELDGLVATLAHRVAVGLHELDERAYNQRNRRAYLVGYAREKFHPGVVEFLGAGYLLVMTVEPDAPHHKQRRHYKQRHQKQRQRHLEPRALVPREVDFDGH